MARRKVNNVNKLKIIHCKFNHFQNEQNVWITQIIRISTGEILLEFPNKDLVKEINKITAANRNIGIEYDYILDYDDMPELYSDCIDEI